MTQAQLIEIMLYQLAAFNDEGVDLVQETKHSAVLSDADGIGAATSKRLYKGAIRWTLNRAGIPPVAWPDNWMEWTVERLSSKLLNLQP
jgi:hypothetical protein